MDPTATRRGCALNQRVLETLMVPLTVVVRDELLDRSSEMLFSNRNDAAGGHRREELNRVSLRSIFIWIELAWPPPYRRPRQ